MKTQIVFILAFIVSLTASAQKSAMLRMPFAPILEKVPPPPASVDAAFAKFQYDPEQDKLDQYTVTAGLKTTLEEYQKQIADIQLANAMAENIGDPNSPEMDLAQKMKDPEYQKKLQSMSEEEKIKFAMQMQSKSAPPKMVLESPVAIKALEACQGISQKSYESLSIGGMPLQTAYRNFDEQSAKAHQDLKEALTNDVAKLPTVQPGEGSDPEPKAYKALMLKYFNKQIDQANGDLKRVREIWDTFKAHHLADVSGYDTQLAAIGYGDKVKNKIILNQFSPFQSSEIYDISELIGMTEKEYERAAQWKAAKVHYEFVEKDSK